MAWDLAWANMDIFFFLVTDHPRVIFSHESLSVKSNNTAGPSMQGHFQVKIGVASLHPAVDRLEQHWRVNFFLFVRLFVCMDGSLLERDMNS